MRGKNSWLMQVNQLKKQFIIGPSIIHSISIDTAWFANVPLFHKIWSIGFFVAKEEEL